MMHRYCTTKEVRVSALPDLIKANESYAASFAKGGLPPAPAKRMIVLTCMDARMDPARFLGLQEGDAHVLRNAGGRATDDALRSIIASHNVLGVKEALVIHHTDCGLATITSQQLHELLQERYGEDASAIDFMTFTDLEQSIRDDVATIRSLPLLADGFGVTGFVYEVETGRLREVT
jgi:carbonic anhydrase